MFGCHSPKALLLGLFYLLLLIPLSSQTISNLRIERDKELGYYKLYFDLSGASTDTYFVTVSATNSSITMTNPPKMSGRGISCPTTPGKDLSIFWHPALAGYAKDGWNFALKAKLSDMILVEGGSFMMGSNDGESNEKPMRQVTLSSFLIGKYEVTQKEWQEIMGSNPSDFKGENLPVERVSWYAALVYCNKRSIKEGLTPVYGISGSTDPSRWGSIPTTKNDTWDRVVCNWQANGYRLPTEAEWEYAARGGIKSKSYKYSGSDDIAQVAWYSSNSVGKTKSAGSKSANELGIYDMSGNVWEWCWDWYADYPNTSQTNPAGANSGSHRVFRGGGWYLDASFCTVSIRFNGFAAYTYYIIGFRCVRVFP